MAKEHGHLIGFDKSSIAYVNVRHLSKEMKLLSINARERGMV